MSRTAAAYPRTATNSPRAVTRPRRARLITLVAASLLASTLNAAPAGAAGGFSDVREGGVREPAITALAEMGIFDRTECGKGLFCPREPIERWVMAVWLIRVLGGEVGAGAASRFADVDSSAWWSRYTEALADREITKGCKRGPLRYCPEGSVVRAQMASFIVRAFDLESAPSAGFADTAGNFHRSDIDALAAAEITEGCKTGPLRYCPDKPVTRAEMATFLHRALQRSGPTGISNDVPAADLTHISTGETVDLRSFFTGDKGVLIWFWAPW